LTGSTLEGREGDDLLSVNTLSNSEIDGGFGGRDTAFFGDLGTIDLSVLDLSTGLDGFEMREIEVLSIEDGAGDDTLTLSVDNVFDQSGSIDPLLDALFNGQTFGPMLSINGDAGDTLALTDFNNYTQRAQTEEVDGRTVNVFDYSAGGAGIDAILAVDQEVTVQSA
ncbi:MAG: hypothetical protein AB8B58_03910, partial [Roseobacter sp.]